jgi:putative ABC transport system permease protein
MFEILRNLARRKLRSTLTISGIVIGIFALTTMGGLAEHLNALLDGGVKYYGSSVEVGPPDGQSAALLPLSKVDEIKKVNGVAAAFPGYQFIARPGASGPGFGMPDTIVAGDPAANSWGELRTSVAQGRQLAAGERGEVVLGTTIAGDFNKKVGDTIDLPAKPQNAKADFVSHSFTVVGILNPTNTAPDSLAYLDTADGQMLLADSLPAAMRSSIDASQFAQSIHVYGKPGTSLAGLDAIATRVNQEVKGVKATKPSDTVANFKSYSTIFTAITTGAAILALVVGGLSVINTMIMAVSERVREIGLKKAVGARTGHVLREYLLEASLIGLIGGLAGWVLAAGLIALLSVSGVMSNMFLVTPRLTVLAIGFAVALGTSAGVVPAFRAARMDPVKALRNAN